MTKINLDELYAQDMTAAEAAVILAKANGFDNVRMADSENLEWVGKSIVFSLGVVWLDTCGDEKADLALLDARIDENVDREDDEVSQYVPSTIWALEYDTQKFADFSRLFVC